MGTTFRSLDTPTLVELNLRAIARNYNRALTDEFIGKLDPDGWHITFNKIPHEHAMGVKVDPHWRCRLLCTLTGDPTERGGTEVWLDIAADDYEALEECESGEPGTPATLLKPAQPLPPFARYTVPQMRAPYGQNVGDIWAPDSEVQQMCLAEGKLLIIEVFANEDNGKPDERLYTVELDNKDPGIQDLISRAREGQRIRLAARSRFN
jgi:hypothetical protein